MNEMKSNRFSKADQIMLFDRLGMYIDAGLTLDSALELARDSALKKHQESIREVKNRVVNGGSLSSALKSLVGINAATYGLVFHGENSGKLPDSLRSSCELMQRDEEIKKKCLSAMVYPSVIAIFAVLITIGLVKGIMPQIVPMLRSLNTDLPILTKVVVGASEYMIRYGIYIASFIAASIFAFVWSYRRLEIVRSVSHYFLLRIPIIGRLMCRYSLSVFLRSYGSLVESGVSSSQAYSDCSHTVSFIPLRNILVGKIESLSDGKPVSSALKHRIIPEYVSQLASAGEFSGWLGKSLLKSAVITDREVEDMLKKVTSLIEPIMMAGIGLVVGSIALSIMMPIYDVSKVLQK